MHRFRYVGVLAVASGIAGLLSVAARPTHTTPTSDPARRPGRAVPRIDDDLPLSFERNDGQTDARVAFVSRGAGYTLFLARDEAVFVFGAAGRRADVLRVGLLGASPDPEIDGERNLAGTASYFIGKDPARWRSKIPTYAQVRYRSVYPGIDLVYYGTRRRGLEYDFVLAAGADPDAIAICFDGARRLRLDGNGDLVVTLAAGGTLVHHAPVAYQERDGRREPVEARTVLTGSDRIGFELAAYDRARPVYIDPGLVYATYLGGTADDYGTAIAVDGAGNAYVTGITDSADFPTTAGAVVPTPPGGGNMFVAKVAADGSGLVYSTYLGGDKLDNFEDGRGIAVDGNGSAYLTGEVGQGGDFPTTAGAFQRTFGGGYSDAYVAKLSPDGSALEYSTFLGGGDTDETRAIAVDASGAAYVAGDTLSNNLVCRGTALPLPCCAGFHTGTCAFPTTVGAFQQSNNAATIGPNAFVTKLTPDGSGVVYSTYLGGGHGDKAVGIAVDTTGHAYVTGNSTSADFPTTTGALQTKKPSEFSIWDTPFVAKLAADGSALAYSTYLGGSQPDDAAAIAVDAAGDAHITGTASSTDFPTTPGAFRPKNLSQNYYNVFVAKLNAAGTGLLYSTYLGGTDGTESGFGIAIGDAGHAYVTGITNSGDFPTTADALQTSLLSAGQNAFVTKLRVDGGGLVYSTYLGGNGAGDYGYAIAVGTDGDAYVTGRTSGSFPVTAGAAQTTVAGSTDAFVARLEVPTGIDPTTTTTSVPTTTSVSSTTSTLVAGSTTTTTLPCATARCMLAALAQTPACVGQKLPATVTTRLTKAATFIDEATSKPAKQQRKLLKRAKQALKQAETKAARASKGRHPKISPACASALQGGIAGVIGGLGI
jgi:hypothetical protein